MAEVEIPLISLSGDSAQEYRLLTEGEAAEAERCFGMWARGYLEHRPSDVVDVPVCSGSDVVDVLVCSGSHEETNTPGEDQVGDREMSLLAGRDEFTPELLRVVELHLFGSKGYSNPAEPDGTKDAKVIVQHIRSITVGSQQPVVYRLSQVWIGSEETVVLAALVRGRGADSDLGRTTCGPRPQVRMHSHPRMSTASQGLTCCAFQILGDDIFDVAFFEYRGQICLFNSGGGCVVSESWRDASPQEPIPGIEFIDVMSDFVFQSRPLIDTSATTPTLLCSVAANGRSIIRRLGDWLPNKGAPVFRLEVLAEREIPLLDPDWFSDIAVDFRGRILVRGSSPLLVPQNDGNWELIVLAPDFEVLGKLPAVPDYGKSSRLYMQTVCMLRMFQAPAPPKTSAVACGSMDVVFCWTEYNNTGPTRWNFLTLNHPEAEPEDSSRA